MRQPFVLPSFVLAAFVAVFFALAGADAALAQTTSAFGGIWTLDRSLSEFPRTIGFDASWLGDPQQGGGQGGSRTPLPSVPKPENYEDAKRIQLLTEEVRNPPARQIIVDRPAAFTITNELGQSRTFHPTGKEELIELQGTMVGVSSTRDADRLVVNYHVAGNRDVRYSYSTSANPSKLIVEVQFLERGSGDKVTRVYVSGEGSTSAIAANAPSTAPGRPPDQTKPAAFDQRPGAELRGLKNLGILIEGFGAQATACGLSQDAIQSSLVKRLTDGGFTVRRNSDEDTYLYVNVITNRMSNGLCVSRYDVYLYSYATATLSHRDQPVLVQVSLMHRGDIDINTPPVHAAAVARGLEDGVDRFITAIRDANK